MWQHRKNTYHQRAEPYSMAVTGRNHTLRNVFLPKRPHFCHNLHNLLHKLHNWHNKEYFNISRHNKEYFKYSLLCKLCNQLCKLFQKFQNYFFKKIQKIFEEKIIQKNFENFFEKISENFFGIF